MPSVDDRIVRMEFDNASFERKISSTLDSLSQLDKALKFTGASKGLSDVGAAADKVSFSGMGNAIEDVSKKFIALSTIAITALAQITTHALQAGASIAKSFTLDPIIDGFREYETQLNAVQTILANTASKGTTLDQVNDALQLLNEYSDKTIYNFGQMARNIGTFTAAGVDLDTSVQSIKGIANLAAMSGSSAEQASTAMYQLSQAIASGSLKLMDWNSVVNAGMGGEAFKSALFETGKAMGTLLDVPMSQTFKEWEDSGHSFRDTLQDGWITADVLTTTLAGFTGDLTEEMLIAKGFSQDAATQIVKTAAIAKAAATEVKTFTQLVGTVKEAVGTGWADSFKIIIGNFTEAKELWTGVNNSIGEFVQKSSDARNAILQGWKDFGGRTQLIDAFKTAFQNIGEILKPIGEAFHNIFPPVTVETLLKMTDAFHRFAESLKPSEGAINNIRSIFQGLFSVLSIGWEVIKEGARFILDLGKSLLSIVGPGVVGAFAKLGDGLTKLQDALVKGGGIKDFFAGLTDALQKPLAFLEKVKDAISNLFSGFKSDVADQVGESFGRIGDRFEGLKKLFERVGDLWGPLEDGLRKVVDVLARAWDVISAWFKELGGKLANVLNKGDFDAVLDMINTGLLAGIVLLLKKFFSEGLKFDFGGGFFEKASGVIDQLSNSLKAFQMNIKANALLKIAGAIAILTGSVLVLSMIDSAALTKALTAMAVGFGELMATFSVFSQMASTPTSAASFTILSAGLLILSGALLVMSLAVKAFSTMDWEELAKGLGSITILLGVLMVATKPLSANAKGMITAGLGITALAVGLVILGAAVKIFATMNWEEMGKGMAGVGAGLLLIAGAIKLMPDTMPITAAGLILVGVALLIIASSMKIFATMKWDEIGRGLVAMGGGLLLIAAAMQGMPPATPLIAAGLILVGIALGEIAVALKLMGKMSWAEIARGLVALGGSLLILAVGLTAMAATIGGALALIIAANALLVLAAALKIFGDMSWDEIIDGLLKVAAALGSFALIALILQGAVGAMLALGAALVVLGVGFALVGVGAYLVAKAFEAFASAGQAGIEVIGGLLEVVAQKLPEFLKAVAEGIVQAVMVFAKSAPVLAEALGKLLSVVIDQLVLLLPKALVLVGNLISGILTLIREKGPEYIDTGLFILTKLLEGIRDNIGPITDIAADIVVNFLNALSEKLDEIVDAGVNLFTTYLLNIAEGLGKIAGTLLIGTGGAFLDGLQQGIEQEAPGITSFFTSLPGKIVGWIGDTASTLVSNGAEFISGLLNGINGAIGEVTSFFSSLPGNVIGWIGDTASALVGKGAEFISGLLSGINSVIGQVTSFFSSLPGNVLNWIGDTASTLIGKGADLLQGLWNGAQYVWGAITGWFGGLLGSVGGYFSGAINVLLGAGRDIIQGLWNGMKEVWDRAKGWLSDIADKVKSFITNPLGIFSPSRVMTKVGNNIFEGLWIGMKDTWHDVARWLNNLDLNKLFVKKFDDDMAVGMTGVLQKILDHINENVEMSPVITPVLDLTKLKEGASQIADYVPGSSTYNSAQTIARHQVEEPSHPAAAASTGGDVRFEQNIYAPTQLSTSDIYKHTRNQITIAKEELSIP